MLAAKGSSEIQDQVKAASARWGLEISPTKGGDIDDLESIESDLAEEVSHATLLIGELTGGQSDSFVHFASGAVIAVPTAGASSIRLLKRVLLVVGSADVKNQMTPGSVRKVKNVRVVTHEHLIKELNEYGNQFKDWTRKQEL